ncbi:MAG: phospho-N-acetylmuramoyl-pentapeptide-transferase [Defluviitaleaceae bacterium]|nr:phospho-N-acetylmuramoyl-pentapeptide-transferase [Defluviitaleaceae bacterium]MCL2835651.1 phospho-N-acetylmuramoyl-pentapeptide-transferase [Defluviitaleaceae bacterium]
MYDFNDAVYAILIAFFVCVALIPAVLPMLRRLKFGQNVRDDGPKTHLTKQGTPTMGGIAIVASILASGMFFVRGNPDAAAVLLTMVGFAAIGFADDYIKVVMKRSLGLRARMKIILQIAVCAGFWVFLYWRGYDTTIYLPFANSSWDLGIFYTPVYLICMVGIVNAVNLTDGVDGLSSGVTVLVTAFFMFIMLALESPLLPIAGAAAGALMGFLLFNTHPARIFMGDTGSLALGGFIISSAMILRMPLVLAIVGFVYIAENLSVIIQTGWFKYTKRKYGAGRRVFKMAPLHHHFEQCGFKETQVVALFYIVTAICCLVGYIAARGLF